MNLPQELDELQEIRVELEHESLSLKEKQKRLVEKARALEQKIIKELNKKNDEARQDISHLESKVNDLEQRLGQMTNETTSQGPNPESTEGTSAQIKEESVEESTGEEMVVVTNVVSSSGSFAE